MGLGCKLSGAGFRVKGLGFRVTEAIPAETRTGKCLQKLTVFLRHPISRKAHNKLSFSVSGLVPCQPETLHSLVREI